MAVAMAVAIAVAMAVGDAAKAAVRAAARAKMVCKAKGQGPLDMKGQAVALWDDVTETWRRKARITEPKS